MKECWSKFEQHKNTHTTSQLKDHLWSLFLYENGYIHKPDKFDVIDGCNCGRNHITLLSNGDVYACRRMKSKVGNIFENNLLEI